MKKFCFILLLITTPLCFADYECEYTTNKLNFITPNSSDIVNTFWQNDKNGYETIKRLYITYTDGSTAVIEHKFCTVYNFEVAYYTSSRNRLPSTAAIEKKMKLFFTYASLQDGSQQESITTMIEALNKKKFTPEKSIAIGHRGFDPEHGDAEYSIHYQPLGDVAIHKAALTIYMGLGVMH